MRRALSILLAAGAFLMLSATTAGAHALLRRSDPAAGAILAQAPAQVVITFTEAPDPTLSTIHTLDASGTRVEAGSAEAVPGNPFQLRQPLRPLSDGVYTVTWRTVSRVDGHVTGGSFAFGVGVSPAGAPAPPGTGAPATPSPSAIAVAGRWALYAGLALLLAAAVTGILVFDWRLPASTLALGLAWDLAVLGLVGMTLGELSATGASLGTLLSSPAGAGLVHQGVGLSVTGVAAGVAALRRTRWSIVLLGLATAASMLLHVLAGHAAAAPSLPWAQTAAQWVHLMAVGIWTGGLVWLFVAARGRDPHERWAAAGRFSFLAGIALAVTVVTGGIRALQEIGGVGAWGRLFDTSFGVALLVKVGLVAILIALGATNRYRNVPRVIDPQGSRPRGLRSLRLTVAAEIAVAALILVAVGVLSELPPSVSVAQAARPVGATQVAVSGSDFATTVRVRLSIAPGTPGPNRFAVTVEDYDTRAVVPAHRVSLRFTLPSSPNVGASTLELTEDRAGTWTGRGTNLSIDGTWQIVVVVQESSEGVEVPLTVRTRLPPEDIQASVVPGQPTLYTIRLSNGRSVQAYVDPGATGANEVHFTFFDASGGELPVASASVSATPPGGASEPVPTRRFGPGHFVADVQLAPGAWLFQVRASAQDGSDLSAYFPQRIAA